MRKGPVLLRLGELLLDACELAMSWMCYNHMPEYLTQYKWLSVYIARFPIGFH